VTAIFKVSRPTFPDQLFLVAPFQILFFTTLGIALMRFGTAAAISADPDDPDDADSEALQEAGPG